MNLLEKLKYLRKINGFTQEQVAKAIGTSGANYSRYENGEQNFTIQHIKKLAEYYNVSISYLFDSESKEQVLITEDQLKILIDTKKVIEDIIKQYRESKK